jgi:hypothetical protein
MLIAPAARTAANGFMTDAVSSTEQVADYRVTRLTDLAPLFGHA